MSHTTRKTRSLRLPQELWDAVQARAEIDGHTRAKAIELLLQGYAEGFLSLPKTYLAYEPRSTKDRVSRRLNDV